MGSGSSNASKEEKLNKDQFTNSKDEFRQKSHSQITYSGYNRVSKDLKNQSKQNNFERFSNLCLKKDVAADQQEQQKLQNSSENINFSRVQETQNIINNQNVKKKNNNCSKLFRVSKTFSYPENCGQSKINNNASLRLIKKDFKDHLLANKASSNEQNSNTLLFDNVNQNNKEVQDENKHSVEENSKNQSESQSSSDSDSQIKLSQDSLDKKASLFFQNKINLKSIDTKLKKEEDDNSGGLSYYSEKSENSLEGQDDAKEQNEIQNIKNQQNDKQFINVYKSDQENQHSNNIHKEMKGQPDQNKKQGINQEDVDANDSFDLTQEIYEFNFIEDLTPQPRTSNKEDYKKQSPYQSSEKNQFQMFSQKQQSQIESLNLNSPFVSVSQVTKNKGRIYLRTTECTNEQNNGEERSYHLDLITDQTQGKQAFKTRLNNKDILLDYGICVLSKKGNQLENAHNMSDYFVYVDDHIKLISVFMGHGAYGNKISNLSCRLLFKHFFKEQLIKLQPQIGFKRLFMNVDKYISQHIAYYDLEQKFNSMLSGASCTLVLIQQNKIFVAYVGNIQAVIFRQQFCYKSQKQNQVQMSGFHIPANQYEKERIQKNTGEIRQWKNDFIDRVFVRGRTFPGIEVTRCFGNDIAKMIGVINEPDIYYHEISKQNDAFLLVTTPNFFDYISYEEVYQILNSFNQKTVKKAQDLLQKRIKNLYSQQIEVITDLAFVLYYFI
ncbi:protein phosphatase 2c (macronuclear) [Tetrahymena thermophila SB210]|uniref:Protein phosphatase 2c n=1 Tax=Tetrahymena thermophila (strain SB210) TaxID=312017 RepID=I7M959_TETTS|nr:protein phosphatase 2c [Tetrahymena thermophila SB210]EAS00847.2 protein phosphatase 2c [Tetrahymena thermophila SB210]|eukprot:XP_001021092.2 protein phosphatase 2c [Tetrahymena thermophila SB210]